MNVGQHLVAARGRLRKYAIKLTKNEDKADDLLQDTCLRVLSKQEKWRDGSLDEFVSWCMVIMHNYWIQGIRQQQRAVKSQPLLEQAIHTQTPDDIAECAVLMRDLKRALAAMSPNHRSLILRAALSGDDYVGLARAEGIKVNTVRSRLSRGRELARHLVEHGVSTSKPSAYTAADDIRAARTAAGLSIGEAAASVGAPYKTYQEWEYGRVKVSDEKRNAILSAIHDEARKPKRDFSVAVLQARRKARLTQAQTGERLGVTREAIRQWESGRSSPGLRRRQIVLAQLASL